MGGKALREVLIGVAILAAVNAGLVPDDPGLLKVSPHPLVFVVAIVAARHGPVSGLLSGVAAAALHLLAQAAALGAFGTGASARSLAEALSRASLVAPLALVLLGLVLGELRRRLARGEVALRLTGEHVRAERDALRTRLALSERTREELERRATEPAATLAAVHEGMQRLASLEPEALHTGIVDLVMRHLLARSVAVYALEEGKLRRKAWRGGDPEPAETRSQDEGLLGASLREGKTLSARDALGRPGLAGSPLETLLAAPLLLEDGRPMGGIAVESIPLASLTAGAERVLAMLADAASRAIERGIGRERRDDARIFDGAVGALRYSHLLERLADEFERSRRYGTAFSLLVLEVVAYDDVPPAGRNALRKALAQALRNGVRKVDHVFVYKDERSFAVTLPHTPEEGAALVRTRIREEIDRYALAPYRRDGNLEYEIGIASRRESMLSPADLAKAAEDAAAAPVRPGEEEAAVIAGAERISGDGTERIKALTPEAILAAKAAAEAETPRPSPEDETDRFVARKEAIAEALTAERPPEETETDGDVGKAAEAPAAPTASPEAVPAATPASPEAAPSAEAAPAPPSEAKTDAPRAPVDEAPAPEAAAASAQAVAAQEPPPAPPPEPPPSADELTPAIPATTKRQSKRLSKGGGAKPQKGGSGERAAAKTSKDRGDQIQDRDG